MSFSRIPTKFAALLGAILVMAPVPAYSTEWVSVASASDDTEVYVDVDSVGHDGKYVSFWQRTIFPSPLDDGTRGFDSFRSVDCHNDYSHLHRLIKFNSWFQVLADYDYGLKSREDRVQPRSVGGAVRNFVCQ